MGGTVRSHCHLWDSLRSNPDAYTLMSAKNPLREMYAWWRIEENIFICAEMDSVEIESEINELVPGVNPLIHPPSLINSSFSPSWILFLDTSKQCIHHSHTLRHTPTKAGHVMKRISEKMSFRISQKQCNTRDTILQPHISKLICSRRDRLKNR